jgi:hypothetical protein
MQKRGIAMDVKSVKEKLVQILETPEDDVKYQAFINDYTMLLAAVKINADTANMAIEAVNLDHGVNFLDTFAALTKKQAQDAWKTIRGCEAYKNNKEYKALKLMSSFAASALGGDTNTASMLGNILTAVVFASKLPKQEQVLQEVYSVLKEYLLEMLAKDVKLPEWKTIKMTPENALIFCELMDTMFETPELQENADKQPAGFIVKKWISQGKNYAEEAIELKEREKNKPPKKSEELLKLVECFKQMEDELDKSIHENAKLVIEKKAIQEDLYKTETEKCAAEKKIKELETEIERLKIRVSEANQEVDERKKLNDAQVQYRADAQVSLLQDIARALKAEYGDYAETKDAPMSEMLGEIYREKLKQIFKILEQKGIKVEG